MNAVRNEENEPKARMFEPDFASRMYIIDRAKDLRTRMSELNPRYREMLSEYGVPTERQMIIRGSRNRLVPTDHDTLTLTRPNREAEAVDPTFVKIHIRIGLITFRPDDPTSDVPTNDVFLEILHKDSTRDLYLVNSSGAWRYDGVDDLIPRPDGELTGDRFMVRPEVSQDSFTRERFEALQMALELFKPDREDNRSADI